MDMDMIAMILAVLLAISEGLAMIPALASNSIMQMALSILRGARNLLKKD